MTVRHTTLKLGHTHDAHEFYLCIGRPGTQYTDVDEFRMARGDLFLFPAGQPHYANAPPDSATEALVLNVSESAVSADRDGERDLATVLDYLCARAWRGENRIPISKATSAAVERTLWEMDRERRSMKSGHRSAIGTGLQRFYLELLRDPNILPKVEGNLHPEKTDERLGEVLRLVEYRYMDPLTVERAAELARLSRSRFHDVFKHRMGATFVEYLTGVRMDAAVRMLKETDAPIIEVAYSCGFPSLSHFYHVFKRRLGRTPREIRTVG